MGYRIVIYFVALFSLIKLSGCSNKGVEGDWMTLDSGDYYAEFYFSDDKIHIYHELTGIISPVKYELINDSLKSGIGNFLIEWVNPDSLLMISDDDPWIISDYAEPKDDKYIIILKRIGEGHKLSYELNAPGIDQIYIDSFYNRMKSWK